MKYRAPLKNALGLGSAKSGSEHWWVQRLTAVALIPLTLWFVYCIVASGVNVGDFDAIRGWIGKPVHSIMLILLTFTMLYHSLLGVEVIVEDYVHGPLKVVTLILSKFAHIVAGVAAIYSIIVISLSNLPGAAS